ncbi:MAG: hypothetical protein OJI67_12665 [Prosthecobacter sp.]|nr:hypothetical protein [Prosthecobacter sp.]
MKNKIYSLHLIISLVLLPACESAVLAEKIVKLGELGVVVAAVRGDIRSGDVVTIRKSVAIVKSSMTGEEKLMAFGELGIEEAIDRGDLSPGDTLIIQEAQVVLKEPITPPMGAFDLTASK